MLRLQKFNQKIVAPYVVKKLPVGINGIKKTNIKISETDDINFSFYFEYKYFF